jgi:eukaryotic-like serine/threonine-protein kinase
MEVNDAVLARLRHVAALPDLTGTRYDLEAEIGRGGMGVVYAAHDRELNRRVALKVLDSALAEEARIIAQIEHPSIVPVYDAGILPDGRAFYVMKLVTGTRLDHWLEHSPSLNERLRIIRRAGEAVGFAHSRGIVHRDLKPQNIMLGEFGEVYVMDWGVEGIAGTPGFRAPESPLDQRADIYALGALLRYLLPTPAPPALQAIAEKAMRTAPAARYDTAASMLSDLDRFEDGLAVTAWSEPWGHRVRRFAGRNALLLSLGAAWLAVKFLLLLLRFL